MGEPRDVAGTGVAGLDEILHGGLPRRRMYLVQGDPGVGKTTLCLQFLLEGRRLGERGLYITLSETPAELHSVARSHGWSLDGVDIYEMTEQGRALDENSLFVPGEVELGERMTELLELVDRLEPRRIVLDSCTELRLLSETPLRFRRQLLALKDDLVRRDCTIVLLDNTAAASGDALLQSLAHGVVQLEQLAPTYGAERRRLRVNKLREVGFRGGFHDFVIREGGLQVFPRLVAHEHAGLDDREPLPTGLAEVDSLLEGGLQRGTSTLLMGPAGAGKSALADQLALARAQAGEPVTILLFDEDIATRLARCRGLGMPLDEQVEAGTVELRRLDPAEISPGELSHELRRSVEDRGARMVIIDSVNGYLHAMAQEQLIMLQMHELLGYLRQKGVATVLVLAEHGLVGAHAAPIDISYLADTVILLRYFEAAGRVRRALSIVKRRAGPHEDTIRELRLGAGGIEVGEPLEKFNGVLSGSPTYWGNDAGLMRGVGP